jgi:WD40 repeat protein
MFSRLNIAFVATLVILIFALPASAEPLINLFGSKTNSPPVATKIAEFTEDFVVSSVDFNADGTHLATNAMLDGLDVHIWDWRSKPHIVRILNKNAAAGAGNALRYSVDGSLLAVGHTRAVEKYGFGLIRVWNAQSGEIVRDIAEPKGAGDEMAFAFTPDGRFFVRTVDRGGQPGDYIVVHSTATWEPVWGLSTLPFIPHSMALSPDGRFAAVGGETLALESTRMKVYPKILFVDLDAKRVVRTIDQPFPEHNEIQTLAWSPDGKSLAVGAVVEGTYPGPDAVKIFDPMTGALSLVEPARSAYVYGLGYTPNGRYLVEGYIENHVRIWDGQHNAILQTIPVDNHFRCVLNVSRDSRYLAIAIGKHVSIWELK